MAVAVRAPERPGLRRRRRPLPVGVGLAEQVAQIPRSDKKDDQNQCKGNGVGRGSHDRPPFRLRVIPGSFRTDSPKIRKALVFYQKDELAQALDDFSIGLAGGREVVVPRSRSKEGRVKGVGKI